MLQRRTEAMPLRLFHTTVTMTLVFSFSISIIREVAEAAAADSSAVGDGGMRRDGLRVAFEGWNFCNEVGTEAPDMGSPRAADCFDLTPGTLPYVVRSYYSCINHIHIQFNQLISH